MAAGREVRVVGPDPYGVSTMMLSTKVSGKTRGMYRVEGIGHDFMVGHWIFLSSTRW
ncbi:MAG: hypothetical protein Ct9H300mP14_10410 [Gammaproteobacteria bacterium]|nr:MAG: hypothetical protein Ct9H300mP14_10410 [Gammaproteobacteria bacterium]